MATVNPVVTTITTLPRGYLVVWELDGLTTTDTYTGQELLGNADRSVQLVGAAGAGGFNSCTVQIQGSNDNSNWVVLTDGLGNNLQFTAAGIKQIAEATRYIRAVVTSGTAGTDLQAKVYTRA